jgi:4-hydroxybenzoate polyprenyltransferase
LERITPYISLLRPHQYLKNLFIFAPLFFGGKMFQGEPLRVTALAFLAFSLVASAIYILNDYQDLEEDRAHPRKKSRPLASGRVPLPAALLLMASLFLAGGVLAFLLHGGLFAIICGYVLLNIFYSLGLKHLSLVDVFIIALGFVLRIYAGAAVTGIPLSMWIVLMTFLLALFLALAKRRDDILLAGQQQRVRKNIDGYTIELANSAMTIMASVIMVSYIMYTVSEDVISRFHTEYLYATTIFVLFGILRYLQVTLVEERSGSPTMILLTDRSLQLTLAAWLASFVVMIY